MSLLHYAFMQRAYLGGSLIALLCALLGLFLVLRRMALIGDGLAHVSFGAIALALLLGWYPFYVALPLVLLASWFILQLSTRSRLYGDTAIGIVSALGMAGGVIIASKARGFSVDLFSFLFGNILTISPFELYWAAALALITALALVLWYNELFAVTFDEEFARVLGIKTQRINTVLILLTASATVLGIRLVGVTLVSALLILPAAAALQLAQGFRTALTFSGLIGVSSVLLGLTVSFLLDTPAGASVVLCAFGFFVAALLYSRLRR